jgi:hypothetical protein
MPRHRLGTRPHGRFAIARESLASNGQLPDFACTTTATKIIIKQACSVLNAERATLFIYASFVCGFLLS